MSRKKKQPNKRAYGKKGAFILPKELMNLNVFRNLSGSAFAVFMALGEQYNGYNNGDLSATHTTMKDWGGMAEGTLCRALKELQDGSLIIKTRTNYKGKTGARCALYALTWRPINECKGKDLEIDPTDAPLLKLNI